MIAKRGVTIGVDVFHAPPTTSRESEAEGPGRPGCADLEVHRTIRLHVVNFTDIQLYIYDECPHEELTIIMKIHDEDCATHFAEEDGDMGLITGESIGQVASQTMQSLYNDQCRLHDAGLPAAHRL